MGDGGEAVGNGVTDGVPRMEVMLGEMMKCVFVEVERMFWSACWGGVSSCGAVRFEELIGLWVVLVEGMGSDMEEGEAAFVLGE